MKLNHRARHRGLHGNEHVDKQRRHALLMVRTAQIRVGIWLLMLIAYPFSHALQHLYSLTTFVTLLSVGALLLTDWGQYAASSAELAAGDAHHDAEATRSAVAVDYREVESDIARLAALQPGPEAAALAAQIRSKLTTNGAA